MTLTEEPRADIAVLVFLACVTSVAAGVIALLFWMMQPVVVPNAAAVEPKWPNAFIHQLVQSQVPEMEQAALDSANEENAELGFETPVVIAAGPAEEEAAPPAVKQAQKPPPKKRVAQAPKREPEPRQAWGFAQHQPFGGFFFFR